MSAAVLSASMNSCKDDPEPAPDSGPTVRLEKADVAPTSLTFTATPSGADRCAYVCVAKGTPEAEAEEILLDGKPLNPAGVSTETVPGLASGTDYVILAAASSDGVAGDVSRLEMTTAADEGEIGISSESVGRNSYSYTVVPASDKEYLHCVVRADELEKASDRQSAMKRLLSESGFRDAGKQTFARTDGQVIDGRTIEVVAGTDYVILAAFADGENTVLGPVYEHVFSTLESGQSEAAIKIKLHNTESVSTYRIVCMPSAGISYYHMLVIPQSEADGYVSAGDEEGLRQLVLSQGTRMEGNMEHVSSGHEKATFYSVLCAGVDAEGNQILCREDFSTLVWVEAYVFNYFAHFGEFSYNTVNYDIHGHGVTHAMRGVFLSSDVRRWLSEGMTYIDIVKTHGLDDFIDRDYEGVNSPESGIIWFDNKCQPQTDYTVIVYAEDSEGNRVAAYDEVTTTAVPDPNARLWIEAYTTDLMANQEAYSYNSVAYDIHAHNPRYIKHGCFLTSDVTAKLAEGETYATIVQKYGLADFTADDYYLAGTPEGSQYWLVKGCEPLTSYTVIVYVEDTAGDTAVEYAEVSTGAAPPESPASVFCPSSSRDRHCASDAVTPVKALQPLKF